ncbi:hypothetical protein DH2020_010836 [Rehmannia glutinosa]|uniref:F-box domain-containing protein n=1 Tax=Rehmannia glutinosa TaxID=99300 RepID=A0ABR0XBQ1_REHGL
MMQCKRSSSIRSSAAIIGSNDDLLTEFLIFFPAKSLIRFQLVSKQWHSVISSPSFRHLHSLHHCRRRAKSQPSFLLRGAASRFFICHPTVKRLVPFSFGFNKKVNILRSCNGLLLLECRKTNFGYKDYYIFNPTTLKFRNLWLRKAFVGLCLVFDPSRSPHYRVLCLVPCENSSSRLLVYDSETHKWKDSVESYTRRQKFCGGIYWNDDVYFYKSRHMSRCYSFKNEKICALDDPPLVIRSPGAMKYHIMESNGHLHSVSLYLKPINKYLYVYEMSDVDFSWCRKYRVDLNPISATFGGNIRLLGMIRGDREEDSILLFHVTGKIMVYRFVAEVFEVLVDFRSEGYFREGLLQFEFKNAHQFIESLAPV